MAQHHPQQTAFFSNPTPTPTHNPNSHSTPTPTPTPTPSLNSHLAQWKAYFQKLPPGYRFKPTDLELVLEYLTKRVSNEPLEPNQIIEVDLYKVNPDKLIEEYEAYGENEWYFFTPRNKKYKNGSRPRRDAVGGFWKATGADKKIEHNGEIVGFRKALVFYTGNPSTAVKTSWIMNEFRVINNVPTPTNSDRLDDCVLCRIYKRERLDLSSRANLRQTEIDRQDNSDSRSMDDEADPQDNQTPCNLDLLSSSYNHDQTASFYGNNFGFSMGYESVFVFEDHELPQYIIPPVTCYQPTLPYDCSNDLSVQIMSSPLALQHHTVEDYNRMMMSTLDTTTVEADLSNFLSQLDSIDEDFVNFASQSNHAKVDSGDENNFDSNIGGGESTR